MKRFSVTVVVLLIVLVGGSKIAAMMGATKLFSNLKSELISVGALNYSSVSTSLRDSEIIVNEPRFKHFVLKKDFSAQKMRLKFESPLDMLIGMVSAFNANYSDVDQVFFDGLQMSIPDEALYDQLSEGIEPPLKYWFSFLSCPGYTSPTPEGLAAAGIDNPVADVSVQVASGSSLMEFETPGIGRIGIELDLLAWLSRRGGAEIKSVSYVENGYFNRLAQTCKMSEAEAGEASGFSREAFAEGVVNDWSKQLGNIGFRLSPDALAIIEQYIAKGGVLLFKSGDTVPAPEEGVYGWQDERFSRSIDVRANDGLFAALGVQRYISPPVKVEVVQPVEKPEPAYVATEIAEAPDLMGRQVRLVTLKGNQREGMVKLAEEHQIEIVPLNGDGKVSYLINLSEIETLEVWVE